MEKYPIFSGLKSLSAQNLTSNKILLPKQGTVGKLLKSGEVITFDLESKDIWIDIQVECKDIKLVIFFETKVRKDFKIETFVRSLLKIVNEILKANKIDLRYDFLDLTVKKMHVYDGNLAARNLKSSMLGQNNLPQHLKELENDSLINDSFDYLDRCLLIIAEKYNLNTTLKDMSFKKINTETEAKMADNMSTELPIRGLRVEEKQLNDEEGRPKHRRSTKEMNSNVCSCSIF
jgi:hypothetical protein